MPDFVPGAEDGGRPDDDDGPAGPPEDDDARQDGPVPAKLSTCMKLILRRFDIFIAAGCTWRCGLLSTQTIIQFDGTV